jgi:hypothetical protein
MATFMIGYDIHPSRGENYDKLWEGIKALGAWWHHLDSTWLVKSQLTAVQIRDRLWKLMPCSDDQLLVVNVSGDEAAWQGFGDSGSKWIKENL